MTKDDLNQVRDLQKKIRESERRLQTLRISADNLVPILDGLPHSDFARSRVEKIALTIIESERELESLRLLFFKTKSELADKIMHEVDEPSLQTLLVLRYVECCTYKETAHRMKITLRHAFRLHEKIFQCHIVAQNPV